ncbi:hypothetical protein RJT34_21579 [Clitoria ternatea]|uniref:Uncharacterized protein n=1 Tax=Clitoria ternatea TaxID=43366 RepID=A0AAN9IUD1_CLITE
MAHIYSQSTRRVSCTIILTVRSRRRPHQTQSQPSNHPPINSTLSIHIQFIHSFIYFFFVTSISNSNPQLSTSICHCLWIKPFLFSLSSVDGTLFTRNKKVEESEAEEKF